jgi:hypothetical protein
VVTRHKKTLRDLDEIKSRVTGDIRRLNKQLLEIASRLDREARSHAVARMLPCEILTSFYRKIVNTSKAIEALKQRRLIEEAWILLRVLLETHVNFFYFLRNDPKLMCQRYADSSVLDKLKHLREVNFYEGTPLASLHRRAKWEATESEIMKRYTSQELRDVRRNGFSGLSFEHRAKSVGLKTLYQSCYRIASRSVHMFDPAETSVYSKYAFQGRPKEKRNLLRLRRQQLEFNQNMLLGRPSYIMAELIKSALAAGQLMLIGLGYEKFRDRISGPSPRDSTERPDRPGTFWIWRE